MRLHTWTQPSLLGMVCLGLLTAYAPSSFALKYENGFPKGCRAIGYAYQERKLVLTPTNDEFERQTLYLIKNKSNRPITLLASDANYDLLGMNWEMTTKPNQWSSFALNKSRLPFVCKREINRNTQEVVDCGDVIEVCEYNNAKFGEHILGSYWVITNQTAATVVSKTIKKGILLRW